MIVTIKEGAGTAVAYECAITGLSETATRTTVTAITACPDGSITDQGPVTWAVEIDYLVSNLPASLHRILRDHDGAAATLTVEPFPVTEPGTKIAYEVTLGAAGAKYTVGAFGAATVSLPVIGNPTTTDGP
jgi:hypothetical protein